VMAFWDILVRQQIVRVDLVGKKDQFLHTFT